MYSIKIESESFDGLLEKLKKVANELMEIIEEEVVEEVVEVAEVEAAEVEAAEVEAAEVEEAEIKEVKKGKKKKEEKKYTTSDVIKALTPVHDKLGKEVAKEVLKAFKASKLSEIPADQIEKFMQYCKETLASSGQEQEDLFA